MSSLIPVGYTSTAVVTSSGDTRIYYQGIDGSIHQLSGSGPVVSPKTKYTDKVVVTANNVRAGTPLASAIATNTGLNNIKLYYVTPDNHLHELLLPQGVEGGLDPKNYIVAPGSNMLYAAMDTYDHPRVGFQASNTRPGVITEAYYNGSSWSQTTLSL